MSTSRLPLSDLLKTAAPEIRKDNLEGMAGYQREAIHRLFLFGDSVNQSGDLPLNGDHLIEQLCAAQHAIAQLFLGMYLLKAMGETVQVSDFEESVFEDDPELTTIPESAVLEEPITAEIPQVDGAHAATDEGGAL